MAQADPISSSFHCALDEYIRSRKKDSVNSKFLQDLQKQQAVPITAEDVHQSLEFLEKNNSNRSSTRNVRQFLEPVIRVLSDYSGIIDTFGMSFAPQMLTAGHNLLSCPRKLRQIPCQHV